MGIKWGFSGLNYKIELDSDMLKESEIIEPLMTIEGKIDVFKGKQESMDGCMIGMICEQFHSDIPVIYVDDYFLKLSEKAQKFVLYHELGHYINGDLLISGITIKERISDFILILTKTPPVIEQKADLYAYYRLGCDKLMLVDIFNEINNMCINEIINSDCSDFNKKRLIKKENKINKNRIDSLLRNIEINYDNWILEK